jgi:hypothetical protein
LVLGKQRRRRKTKRSDGQGQYDSLFHVIPLGEVDESYHGQFLATKKHKKLEVSSRELPK